jgi:putative ABC transport system ATP-binding protein
MFSLKKVIYKHILEINDLNIKRYKVTCIVGESGSGKSTLLRLLNKLISYDSGEIFYNGQSLNSINSIELRRNVGMLPQLPVIFPGSIKDNLLIGLKFAEKPLVDDKKLRTILNIIHLNKNLDDNSDKLSGGERQRLALGRLILIDSDVFLLDEPSSAMDEKTENIIIKTLVSYIQETNKTLIMVTHSKKVAQTYAENIIEIHQGKVIDIKEV